MCRLCCMHWLQHARRVIVVISGVLYVVVTNGVVVVVGGGGTCPALRSRRPELEDHELQLTRLHAGMWTTSMCVVINVEQNPVLFVDRNPLRFGFILDFFRDGKVTLPHSITKDDMATEFEYFNIDVPEGSILTSPMHGAIICHELQVRLENLSNECTRLAAVLNDAEIQFAGKKVAQLLTMHCLGKMIASLDKSTSFDLIALLKERASVNDQRRMEGAVSVLPKFWIHLNEALRPFGIEASQAKSYLPHCRCRCTFASTQRP